MIKQVNHVTIFKSFISKSNKMNNKLLIMN